jgi:DNA-binding HxlR family transcriptional regulator
MVNKKLHNDCPIAKAALLLSDPWTILIIRDLLKKQMRFSDLEKSLKGISSRTLTIKIKQLEVENIIQKKDLHYYSITLKGAKFKKILKAMADYGKSFSK